MALLLPWLTRGRAARLEGARVVLEPPRRSHFAAWAALRAASRDELEPFEPQWSLDELTWPAWRRRLRRYAHERRQGTGHAFLVFRAADRALVGGMSLANVRHGVQQTASVGYWIGAPFMRQGYASDALEVLLAHAFDDLGLNRIVAACLPGNEPSLRVLERSGFVREGLARRCLKINGQWKDHVILSLLADEWPADGSSCRADLVLTSADAGNGSTSGRSIAPRIEARGRAA